MISRSMIFPRRRITSIVVALLLTCAIFSLPNRSWKPYYSARIAEWQASIKAHNAEESDAETRLPELTLPELDAVAQPTVPPSAFCAARFTGAYLDDLRNHSIQYCTPNSTARVVCFHAHAREDQKIDSFCMASGAVLDSSRKKFALNCQVNAPTANETSRGIIPLGAISGSWYDTGPRPILDGFIDMIPSDTNNMAARPSSSSSTVAPKQLPGMDGKKEDRFIIMAKREGSSNLWHTLMEIWSMAMSMDVLRTTHSSIAGREDGDGSGPLFRYPDDMERTQVLLLDDLDEKGATFDLWRLFSGRPAIRFKDVLEHPSRYPELTQPSANITHNLILPLAGGTNPLWQNDWLVRDCNDAPLLELFVRRVFAHLKVPYLEGPKSSPTPQNDAAKKDNGGSNDNTERDIIVTFINRTGSRRLRRHEALLQRLNASNPHIVVKSVDMAELSMADQIRLVQETDILVGVHGAGLTHIMFMRKGAGAVVEIQPENFTHKGFRNLAAMRGQLYFRAHGEMIGHDDKDPESAKSADTPNNGTIAARDSSKDWHTADVRIEEERFLTLMDAAIKSLYNAGYRNYDVV